MRREPDHTTITLVRPDGTRAEVDVGDETWGRTEYNADGEAIQHQYGTTLNGVDVIVTQWQSLDENGQPTGGWEQEVERYDPDAPEPDVLTAMQIGGVLGSELAA